MRRKEKEITDKNEIIKIIRSSQVCRLGLADDNKPYIVPLCFGYKDNTLYFHSAQEGKKVEIIKKNPNICFEFDQDSKVVQAEKPCSWGVKYKSIIGFGKVQILESLNEKREALKIIMSQYSPDNHEFKDSAITKTFVFKVEVSEITGKQAKD